MKKLMFATALVASAAAFADGATALNANGFEGYSVDAQVGNTADVGGATSGMYFCYEGDTDGSLVKEFGSGDVAAPSITRPYYFQGVTPNGKYLELSTEGGILWRSIGTVNSYTVGETTTYSNGNPVAIAETGTYLDTLVQFTPTEDGGAPELTQEDKLAIWLNVDSNGVTNLMVRAGYVDSEGALGATNFVLSGKTVVAGEWYRLTIKALPDILQSNEELSYPAFMIKIDNTLMSAGGYTIDSGFVSESLRELYLDGMDSLVSEGKLFVSLVAGDPSESATLQGVGFKGSGALDDIVWTEDDLFAIPAGIDFTLTWPAGLTAVSYTVGTGSEPVAISGNSPFTIQGVQDGALVTFVVQNADGAQKVLTATAGNGVTGIDATGTTFTWADYLGEADAVTGAYGVDTPAELVMLQKGVNSGLATAGETFVQTANIDMTGIDGFYGIGWFTASSAYASLPQGITNKQDLAFAGTYDGAGYTISNVTIVRHNYAGVFNNVEGTVKDLTVSNISLSGTCDEWGCAIVGNSQRNAILENLTASGTTCNDANHNVAGIVVRPVDSTIIRGCVNNVAISATAKRVGGIAAFVGVGPTQNSNVQIIDCTNTAALVSTDGTRGVGGILGCAEGGSTETVTIIRGCVDLGSETAQASGGHAGAIVGSNWSETKTYTDDGGNTFKASTVDCGYVKNAVFGRAYATASTIDGTDYLTTVKAADLAAGGTYTLLTDIAASETPVFMLQAAGDTIAFDTARGFTFAGTVDGAQGLTVTDATVGTVTTYTAAAAGGDDYVVEIDGSDVVVTPSAEDLAVVQAAVIAGGGTLDVTDVAAVNAAMAAPIGTTGIPSWQALFLGLPPTEAGLESFKIDSITIGADGKVTVALPDGVDPKVGRGVTITLKLMGSNDLSSWTQIETAGGTDNKTFAPVQPGLGETKKFYKVVVEFAGSSAQN